MNLFTFRVTTLTTETRGDHTYHMMTMDSKRVVVQHECNYAEDFRRIIAELREQFKGPFRLSITKADGRWPKNARKYYEEPFTCND